MPSTIAHPVGSEPIIHHADRFPITQTDCGKTRAPATDEWRYVS